MKKTHFTNPAVADIYAKLCTEAMNLIISKEENQNNLIADSIVQNELENLSSLFPENVMFDVDEVYTDISCGELPHHDPDCDTDPGDEYLNIYMEGHNSDEIPVLHYFHNSHHE